MIGKEQQSPEVRYHLTRTKVDRFIKEHGLEPDDEYFGWVGRSGIGYTVDYKSYGSALRGRSYTFNGRAVIPGESFTWGRETIATEDEVEWSFHWGGRDNSSEVAFYRRQRRGNLALLEVGVYPQDRLDYQGGKTPNTKVVDVFDKLSEFLSDVQEGHKPS